MNVLVVLYTSKRIARLKRPLILKDFTIVESRSQ
jgi:hypothetical protein